MASQNNYSLAFQRALRHNQMLEALIPMPKMNTAASPRTSVQALARAAMAKAQADTNYGATKPKSEKEEEKRRNAGFQGTKRKSAWEGFLETTQINDVIEELQDGKSPGSRIIDLLSRGGYATNNALLESQKFADSSGGNVEADELDDFLKATISGFGRGLTGEDKTLGSDVLAQTRPNDSDLQRGVGGFAMDVLGDPLTYIPVANVASVGAKLTRRGAQAVPKVDEAAESLATVPQPVMPGRTVGGNIVVDKGFSDAVRSIKQTRSGASSKKEYEALQTLPEESRQLAFDLDENGLVSIVKPPPEPTPFERFTQTYKQDTLPVAQADLDPDLDLVNLRSSVDALSDMASKVPKRQYPKDLDIKDIYEDAPINQGPVDRNAVLDAMIDADHQVTLKNGDVVSIDQVLEDYAKAPPARQAKIQATLDREIDAVSAPQIGPQRISPGAIDEWATQYKDVLDPKDITYLKQASNRASFNTRRDKVMGRKIEGGITNWQDLMAAIERGDIEEADLAGITKMLGAKSSKGMTAKARALVNKRIKAEEAFRKKSDRVARDTDPFEGLQVHQAERSGPGEVPPTQWDVADVARTAETQEVTTKADSIVDQVAKGDVSAFESPRPQITEVQADELAKHLPTAAARELVDPERWKYISGRSGAKRTSNVKGKGYGRHLGGWNSYSQIGEFRVIGDVSKRLMKMGLRGADLRRAKYDEVMPMLRTAALMVRNVGMEPVAGHLQSGYPMSLFDVLSNLPRSMVDRYLFDFSTSVFPSKILDATKYVLDEYLGKAPIGSARQLIIDDVLTPSSQKNALSPGLKSKWVNKEEWVGGFADAMVNAMPKIAQVYEKNLARVGLKVGDQVAPAVKQVRDELAVALNHPLTSMEQVVDIVKGAPTRAANIAKQRGANADAAQVAKELADAEIRTIVSPGDFGAIKTQNGVAIATGGDARALNKALGIQFRSGADEADVLHPKDAYNIDGSIDNAFNNNYLRKLYPVGGKLFSGYGHDVVHRIHLAQRNALNTMAHLYRGELQKLHSAAKQSYGAESKDIMRSAFKAAQEGRELPPGPVADQLHAMTPAINRVFDDVLDRNGITSAHMNEYLDQFGVPDTFRFDPELPPKDQWKSWLDVDDPLDMLDRFHAASMRALTDVTVGSSFTHRFGVDSPRAGYVRIAGTPKTTALKFIDQDKWYPKEIAQELHLMDDLLSKRLMIDTLKNNHKEFNKALKLFDGTIQAWKTGQTIYRLGHHIRNMVGDMTLSWLAGVNNPLYYQRALKVMVDRRGEYDGFDGLAALGTLPKNVAEGKSLTLFRGKPVSNDAIYRAMHKEGVLLDFRTLEDTAYAEETNDFFLKMRQKSPFKGKVHNLAAGISQNRDHLVRIAHFMHEIEHMPKSVKTFEQAAELAANKVRKWHPDGSDLARWEHEYGRRIFMFYSWVRKTIPLIIEAAVMNPGKVTMIPKAQYNFAVSMGIDPESLYDPFPQDQLFPDFLTDEISGPQFQGSDVQGTFMEGLLGVPEDAYIGMDPGFASNDIINQFAQTNAPRSFAGTLNPLIRVPIELGTGQNIGIGTPITDKSDYLDSQIPGLNSLTNISNRSAFGGGATQANEAEYINGERVPIENPGVDNLALLNWITGLGLQNMSKESYIRRAEIEERTREKAERERARGN